MKKVALLFGCAVVLFATYLFAFEVKKPKPGTVRGASAAVTCSWQADVTDADTTARGKFIALLPGWGNYNYPIATASDSTRLYFNQGLTLYYSYHMKEAFASFKEAARFDPAAPMVYWGQALSLGPYYNAGGAYIAPAALPAVLKQMNVAAAGATGKEKELLRVMSLRYPQGGIALADNGAYAQGMRKLIDAYPSDVDIRMLYIDAVMLIHPWDFWESDGRAKAWTPELVELCKAVLITNPNHPAALHYYIHLTEASRNPEVAADNAQALKTLFPGVAHMVHMASHVYQRTGLYFQGVDANVKAEKSAALYAGLAKNIASAKSNPHVLAVETYCAFSGAMYQKAMDAALRCRKSVTPSAVDNYSQYLYMMPVFTMVRLGKWHELLKDSTAINPGWRYACILNNFARGLAFLYTGEPDSAAVQLQLLRDKLGGPALKARRIPFNTAFEGASIAENMLDGAILLGRNKYDDGMACLKKAMAIEDAMIYTEPADWPIPVRQFLGAYLLKSDYNPQAEQVYREDLERNPGNGWSMLGMYQSLKAQNRKEKLAYYKAGFLRSFSHADVAPVSSVFMN
ncbi:hypothetical protein [Mucilaginibacter celer]|uniref:Tetratricopeptide repeat protein n=1 Tax=Mucilaginibacter celer TaxID=2305508 RepID=A0A494W5V6_9SPHI|nr:hypothetical protein [Mucilaginibacter celer]AYL98895.1 hypothetical protein HYN43_028080 [Mucilaginibacter celer]